jgi:glycosyltransferase involved in cell wall biosynthesis
VLHDGETGLLVRQNAWADLAMALARLLGDPELRVRVARAARHLIEREFDVRKNAALMRSLFDSGLPVESARAAGGVAP